MMPTQKKVDVVTVGGGWTANVLAWKLTQAGKKVVSLEAGPSRFADPTFNHDHDPMRWPTRKEMMWDISKEAWTWRPNPDATALPMRKFGSFHPGRGIGGAGVHWSAQFWRFLPSDFNYRTHYIDRYGKDVLPPGSTVQDWPVTYDELEPYYDQIDYDIGASGLAGNIKGNVIPGGNPFEGPRSRPYPLPPLEASAPSALFRDGCEKLGYHPFPQPAGILSQAYKDPYGNYRSGCLYCGFCTRYGCEVDAKTSAITTHIPLAMKSGKYEIRTFARVRRINVDGDGLATGVTYVDAQGVEQEQPADVVLVTAYTLNNNRLLMLSKSNQHPNGIGNDHGMLGKNYTYQLYENVVTALYPGRRFNMFTGNSANMNVIYDFNGDNFDHSGAGFIGGAQIYSALAEREPIGSATDVPIDNGDAWGVTWKESLRNDWDSYFGIGIEGESLPYTDQFLDLDPNYKDNLGDPLLRITFDWHDNDRKLYSFMSAKIAGIAAAMGVPKMSVSDTLGGYVIHKYQSTHCTGGCMMGTDPGSSVTNKYGQVWGAPNVFVTGAALYPQNPGANPTDTLLALAYMTGDVMRDRFFKHPDRMLD
jgi:gluconate 2-dehydrogenase alpha chain